MEQEISSDIKKIKSPVLRILLGFGMLVISTLFGMYIKSDSSSSASKDETIKTQTAVITELRAQLNDCKDARYNDKELEYQRVLKRQIYADSINSIIRSIRKKNGIKNEEN
jgi:hypothetical protein